jgi:hypothetical protein
MKSQLITGTAAGIVLVAALAACSGGSHSSGAGRAAASSIAANPTVKADEQSAAAVIRSCANAAHITQVKACLEGKVALPQRKALEKCLASDATSVIGVKDAKARFEQGAQSCVATALLASTPGATANIPGFPASPSPSWTIAHASAS